MFLALVVLLTALMISIVAAWFSIIGLTEIFSLASAFWPVVIMGSVLEVGKLVLASTMYQRWSIINWSFRAYFSLSMAVLMLITSMGIFGYLSRAHLEAIKPVGNITERISLLDAQVEIQKGIIISARDNIAKFQTQLTEKTFEGFQKYRSNTKRALAEIKKNDFTKVFVTDIENASKKIESLQMEKLPLSQKLQDIETEVGPVRYVAELIYGDRSFAVLDKAVRLVIILIVVVFDPLAVALIVMANKLFLEGRANVSIVQKTKRRKSKRNNGRSTPIGIKSASTKDTHNLVGYLVDAKDKPEAVGLGPVEVPMVGEQHKAASTQDGETWLEKKIWINEDDDAEEKDNL